MLRGRDSSSDSGASKSGFPSSDSTVLRAGASSSPSPALGSAARAGAGANDVEAIAATKTESKLSSLSDDDAANSDVGKLPSVALINFC